MTAGTQADSIREAVGVFDNAQALQEAVDELLSSGFDRSALSLLAAETAVEEKLGHKFQKIAELEDDPIVPRCSYISTESIGDAEGGLISGLMYIGATATAGAVVASGGTLALVISAAALAGGVGGLFGALLAGRLGKQHAEHLQEQLDHGGLLLWVRTWSSEDEARAGEILARHSGRDVHVHTLPGPASLSGGNHVQETLDEALDETFPASDALAMLEPSTNSDKTKS
ncbi:hypothetical protein [Amorphus sp. 3PC139-8]|uniref:hypothetical protein n=1 Tax=Amorphus sp. 3PC139-8 TaxID=2735676 RepID=UPI00345E0109